MRKLVGLVALVLAGAAIASLVGCALISGPTTTASTTTISTTTTTTEPPASWDQLQPAGAVPAPRCYQAMVYDAITHRVLMIGGFDGTKAIAETWAYDANGDSWAKLNPAGKGQPSEAEELPAVFDPSTKKVIAFDGTTWGYDATANMWKALSPKSRLKSARKGASMVLDSSNGKLLLFGGTDMTKWYNETWSYDPVTNGWMNLQPAGDVPPGRSDAGMAYDPTSEKVILFGGVDADFNCLSDTWSYDPATNSWTKLATDGAPSARCGHGMAYDPHTKMIILFGGIDSQFTCYNDTWAFDPAAGTWTQLHPVGSSPSVRGRSALVYSADMDKLVLFGGATIEADSSGGLGTQVLLNDTWVYGVNLGTGGAGSEGTTVPPATSTTLSALGAAATTAAAP